MTAKRTEEPHDRLTHLCDAMTRALEEQEGYDEDVRCIVFLQDSKRGGLQLHGYEDDTQAMVDLLLHVQALFEANGKKLMFAPVPGQG